MRIILGFLIVVMLLGCDNSTNVESKYRFIGEMVEIFASDSTFIMGDENIINAKPERTITFSYDFKIRSTEVTQFEYDTIMSDSIYGYKKYATPYDTIGSYGIGDNFPAYSINWYDAVLFCNAISKYDDRDTVYKYDSIIGIPGNGAKLSNLVIDMKALGYRLPTEAEWEYSCRAGEANDYYWGKNFTGYPSNAADTNELNNYAVWRGNSDDLGLGAEGFGTEIVGKKKENNFGLFNMSGNVKEWCNDWYNYDEYQSGDIKDPKGPTLGDKRVIRGGCWSSFARDLRSAYRYECSPEDQSIYIGFRYVLNETIPENW